MAVSVLNRRNVICVFVFMLDFIKTGICSSIHHIDGAPSDAFHNYYKFTPYILSENQRIKRSIDAPINNDHLEEFSLIINAFDKEFVIDLQMNRDLLPKHHFEKYQHQGKYVLNRPHSQHNNHCYYKGRLHGVNRSWAAVSTCAGISGVIFDGKELYYIQPIKSGDPSPDDSHFIYKHSDLKPNNLTCGFENSPQQDSYVPTFLKRLRRSSEIHGPYNSNSKSRYVELVLVNDNLLYKEMKEDIGAIVARSKDIANIANALYAPLNIFIALVGVVVWSNFDEITLSTDGDATLTSFLYYRKQRLVQEHPNDNAQLITGMTFNGGVVGKALKGPICTYEYSGGVNMDHNPVVGLVATTVAHELGHNFGMEHDDDDCLCPEEKCIMAPASSRTSPTHWSSCSKYQLKMAFEHGMDYCLRNKPTTILGPVCGNGFVEEGEECDCGLTKFCDNRCCNASSCTLYANASCASGSCCDLGTCQIKPIATLCRLDETECDLPEFCNGKSEYCPSDVYKENGIPCKGSRAFCFEGQCRTHTDQCKLLWGPTGQMSDKLCFDHNSKGNANGNCGYFQVNKTYRSCLPEDSMCGMLHCTHLNERLEFGMENVAILSRSFITEGDQVLTCRSAIVDLGLNSVDPGLAPNGAKCGEDKLCVNQRCLPVSSFKLHNCPNACGKNGVCNSNGHCHCNIGYEPPLCDYPGTGGSIDSGPATNPNASNYFAYAMYIIFLAIIPMIAVTSFVFYYYREHIKTWWITKAREKAISRRTRNAYQRRMRAPTKPVPENPNAHTLEISIPASVANSAPAVVAKSTPMPVDVGAPVQNPCSVLPPCTANLQRTHSVKAAKLNLDRNSLRNLEISYPIPQSHVALPPSAARALPIRPAPPRPTSPPQISGGNVSEVGTRPSHSFSNRGRPPSWSSNVPARPAPVAPSVMRAASMNEGATTVGSKRLKRLSSGSFRPTNPPPCPPPLRGNKFGGKLPDSSSTEQIYDSIIYSDPAVDICQGLDKGRLQLMENEGSRQASESVSKPSKLKPLNSHLYSKIKSPGHKSSSSQPSCISAKMNTNNGGRLPDNSSSVGNKFQANSVAGKLPTSSVNISNQAKSSFMDSSRTNASTAATAGGSSVVGNLARRFESQLSSESAPSSKLQGKDSFRLGSTVRQNKPSLPPKSSGSANVNNVKLA